jgi:hypothetical protein
MAAAASSAMAQENFPDTPSNHWAYEALSRLKREGIVVGYPDGLYRGSRPISRYEMAVALNAAYVHLTGKIQNLQQQVDALSKASDRGDIKDLVRKIQDGLDQIKKLGPDLDDLKRAADTFELELEQLGVDTEKMKRDLGNLENRIDKLEAKKAPIEIHGDTDFWFGAGTSLDQLYGINKDGRLEGIGIPGGAGESLFPPVSGAVGMVTNSTTLHEAAFTLSGTNTRGPQWSATVVESDMFGNLGAATPTAAFGNQSDVINPYVGGNSQVSNLLGYSSGLEDIYLQEGSIRFGGPTGFLNVGRLGFQLNPYMFRRIDNTTYYSNDRWDNGNYYFDGALMGGSLGPAKLTLFGGLNSSVQTLQGVQLNPLRSGSIGGIFSPVQADFSGMNIPTGILTFDRSLGGDFKLGIGRSATLDLGYALLESDTPQAIDDNNNDDANHLSVYGADGDWRIGPVDLEGGYHKSDIQVDSRTVVGTQNGSWNTKIGLERPNFGISAEYRQVEPDYVAPGDWGRLGVLRNPTNIKGLRAGGHLRFFKRFNLSANGLFDSGLLNDYAVSTYLGTGTTIRGYDVRLSFDLSTKFAIFTELENTHIAGLVPPSTYTGSYTGSSDPNYKWTTFGLNYRLSPSSFWNVAYEQSDIDNDYQVSSGASFHGGFLTSQVTYKF